MTDEKKAWLADLWRHIQGKEEEEIAAILTKEGFDDDGFNSERGVFYRAVSGNSGATPFAWSEAGVYIPGKTMHVAAWEVEEATPRTDFRCPEIEPDMIPEPIRAWIEDRTLAIGTNFSAGVPPAIGVLSACIGARAILSAEPGGKWRETATLYCALIGESGTRKSPIEKQMVAPFQKLEGETRARYTEAQAAYLEAMKDYEAMRRPHLAALHQPNLSGDKRIDHELALEEIEENKPTPPTLPAPRTIQRITPEKLIERFKESPNGLFLFQSEGRGIFDEMREKGREAMRAVLLKAVGGEETIIDTISRGETAIKEPWLTVYAATQPGVYAQLTRQAQEAGAEADGLTQRFQILALADLRDRERGRYNQRAEEAYAYVVEWLYNFDPEVQGGFLTEQHGRAVFSLRKADREGIFYTFEDEITEKVKDWRGTPFAGHLSKVINTGLKLALIFHMVKLATFEEEEDRRYISRQALQMGFDLARRFADIAEWFYTADESREELEMARLRIGHTKVLAILEKQRAEVEAGVRWTWLRDRVRIPAKIGGGKLHKEEIAAIVKAIDGLEFDGVTVRARA